MPLSFITSITRRQNIGVAKLESCVVFAAPAAGCSLFHDPVLSWCPNGQYAGKGPKKTVLPTTKVVKVGTQHANHYRYATKHPCTNAIPIPSTHVVLQTRMYKNRWWHPCRTYEGVRKNASGFFFDCAAWLSGWTDRPSGSNP